MIVFATVMCHMYWCALNAIFAGTTCNSPTEESERGKTQGEPNIDSRGADAYL